MRIATNCLSYYCVWLHTEVGHFILVKVSVDGKKSKEMCLRLNSKRQVILWPLFFSFCATTKNHIICWSKLKCKSDLQLMTPCQDTTAICLLQGKYLWHDKNMNSLECNILVNQLFKGKLLIFLFCACMRLCPKLPS